MIPDCVLIAHNFFTNIFLDLFLKIKESEHSPSTINIKLFSYVCRWQFAILIIESLQILTFAFDTRYSSWGVASKALSYLALLRIGAAASHSYSSTTVCVFMSGVRNG